jgi:hypothetical protein
LTPEQRARLELPLQGQSSGTFDRLKSTRSRLSAGLTPEQSQLYQESFRRPRRHSFQDNAYPADRAKRWVFMRVLRLGWTPKEFGKEDRNLGRGGSGRAHKAERWGKKYQWIAYHELLARVADNFHTARQYTDHQNYEGLHQIIGDREIDPSLPPVPFHQLFEPERGNDTWRPSTVTIPQWPPAPINFQQIGGSLTRFINDIGSEPTLDRVVLIEDSTGEPWVLLDATIDQGDPGADKPWLGLQQHFYLNSWFVPAPDSARALRHLPGIIRAGHHDLVDDHGHVDCCYVGEIGWSPHRCGHRHAELVEVDVVGKPVQMANTVENYLWEGSTYDCSIGDSVSATLPSTFIQSRSAITWDERGPSWWADGQVIFTNCLRSDRDRQRGFLVRASWLCAFMKAHNVELVAAASTLRWRLTADHRRHSDGHDPEQDDRLDVYAAVRVDSDLALNLAPYLRLLNHEEVRGTYR